MKTGENEISLPQDHACMLFCRVYIPSLSVLWLYTHTYIHSVQLYIYTTLYSMHIRIYIHVCIWHAYMHWYIVRHILLCLHIYTQAVLTDVARLCNMNWMCSKWNRHMHTHALIKPQQAGLLHIHSARKGIRTRFDNYNSLFRLFQSFTSWIHQKVYVLFFSLRAL